MPLNENVVAPTQSGYRNGYLVVYWTHCILIFISFSSLIFPALTAQPSKKGLFPLHLHGAVFLPHDKRIHSEHEEKVEHYLATIESIMPIIDIAIIDAGNKYLRKWIKPNPIDSWLEIHEAPIKECEDQKRAAWAALEALQWTNGSGLDVGIGPACDYVLATVTRILSFHSVPMFTNAGFSEFFNIKDDSLLTRVGPLQDHITNFVHKLALRFNWRRPQLLYQKSFWESELREAGFCKLLMQGMYVWTVDKKWDLQVSPRILPSFWDSTNPREFFKTYMIDTIGTNYGGWFPFHRFFLFF